MPERLPVVDIADLLPFVARHACSGLGATPAFLLTLSRGLDGVFDLHDAGGRALVAVLTDACDNTGDAAGLVLLASRDETPGENLLALLLDAALAEARRGPRSKLEIDLDGPFAGHRALLQARGLVWWFDIVTMERQGPWRAVEPPAGWTWVDLSAARYDEAARRAHALGKPIPVRLLLDGERVAGWVSVRAEPDGSAMVEGLARHPVDRGRGLGAVLLTEALRVIERARGGPVRLDVAAANEGTLRLYEAFGFRAVATVPVHAVATLS